MVRLATERDLDRINAIRAQVSALHAAGRPDVFKTGFCQELRDRGRDLLEGENSDIFVVERDGTVCGMAGVEYLIRPESAYCWERKTYYIPEFGVDEAFRHQGIGRELLEFLRKDALDRGFSRMELDAWEFNEGALAFYKAVGFQTFREFLEWNLTEDK